MSKQPRSIIIASLAVLSWLVVAYPVLFSVHLEGFTAQTQSIALMLSRSASGAHDPYMPLLTQFIFETRAGVVLLLANIFAFWPMAGDEAYRGLVTISLLVLIFSSIWFARKVGGVNWSYSALALALTPGLAQAGYYFNDNIVAAALATLALCVAQLPGVTAALLAGATMALAVQCRIDAVMLGPVLLCSIYLANKVAGKPVLAAVAAALFAGSVVLGSFAVILGFDVFHALEVASEFAMQHGEPLRPLWARLYFFGPIALILIPIGASLLFRNMEKVSRAAWIAYPLLLSLFAPKVTETRYVLPMLAPFIALHMGYALEAFFGADRSAFGSRLRFCVALVIVVLLVCPAGIVQSMDGPRAFVGRIHNLYQWRLWQESVDESQRRLEEMLSVIRDEDSVIVVSTHYNDELFTRLRLIERGYQPLPAAEAFPGCSGFGAFIKDHHRIAHVRTEPQYRIGKIDAARSVALQVVNYESCARLSATTPLLLTTFGANNRNIQGSVLSGAAIDFQVPLDIAFNDHLAALRPKTGRGYGLFGYHQVSEPERAALATRAKAYLGSADFQSEIAAYLAHYRALPAKWPPRASSVRAVLDW